MELWKVKIQVLAMRNLAVRLKEFKLEAPS